MNINSNLTISEKSEGDVWCQPVNDLRGKVPGQAEVLQTLQVAVQTSIVDDGLGLIVIDIRMAAQLLKGELIDIQLLRVSVMHHEIFLGFLRKALYLVQLIYTDIASQPLSIADYLTGIICANPGHLAQFGGISRVQHDMLGAVNLPGVWLIDAIRLMGVIGSVGHRCYQGGGWQVVGANADVGFRRR